MENKKNGPYILPDLEILIFIRYLATGSFILVAGELCSIKYSTSWRSIHKLISHLTRQSNSFIKFPLNLDQISVKFQEKKNIPNVVGCIDGTHIPILVPNNSSAETFRNRKGFFSLNIQMICGPDMKVYDIDAGWPGSCHDSTIWRSSGIFNRFRSGEFAGRYLLGDSAYPLSKSMISPFRNPVGRQSTNFLVIIVTKFKNISITATLLPGWQSNVHMACLRDASLF